MKSKKFIRLLSVVAVLLLVYIATRYAFQIVANRGLNELIRVEPYGKSGSDRLIVVVHAYQGSNVQMSDVRKAIEESRNDAEILMVQYPAGTWSNADCFQISSKLCEEINRRYTANRYKSIEFVGYSMGALLARKSYVYACGHIEDLDPNPASKAEMRPAYEWATNGTVKRFVLLAGTNRGWSTRIRPNGMTLWHQFLYKAGKLVGWATDTGRLICQCETGEPFVANLRLQWMEAIRALPKDNQPKVIQLLGDTDDIVSSEDSRDANVARDFVWVQLAGTNHLNAAAFRTGLKTEQERKFGEAREQKFKEALGDDNAIKRLKRASPDTPEAEDNQIVEAVIVLHGIRDYGEWTTEFESALQKRFMDAHDENEKLLVYRPKYGYFPMGRFLLFPERQKKVRWFMDELTELQAKYPKLKRINFIGHSNGTYILASTLWRYKALKSVKRVVFAGSVVPQDFDWTAPCLEDRVDSVRAYAGSSDWVVAWFPRLFEIWPFNKLGNDIGSAGFNGFTKPAKMSEAEWKRLQNDFLFQTRFVEGGHGTAIEPADNKIESVAGFVIGPSKGGIGFDTVAQNRCLKATSDWAVFVWLAILAALVGGWVVVGRFPGFLKHVITARWPAKLRRLSWCDEISIGFWGVNLSLKTKSAFLALYAGLILFILLKF
jgi:predicted esterase